MTTIAWDGNTLAGDTLCHSSFCREVTKIFKIDKDTIFGGAGFHED